MRCLPKYMNIGKVILHLNDLWSINGTCETEFWHVCSWFRKPTGFSLVPIHLEVGAMQPLIDAAKSSLRDWQTWKDACKWPWNSRSHITSAARILQRYLSKSSMWLLLRQWGLQFLNAAVRQPSHYYMITIGCFTSQTSTIIISATLAFFGNLTAAWGCILFH